jgi:hypothetical protein
MTNLIKGVTVVIFASLSSEVTFETKFITSPSLTVRGGCNGLIADWCFFGFVIEGRPPVYTVDYKVNNSVCIE